MHFEYEYALFIDFMVAQKALINFMSNTVYKNSDKHHSEYDIKNLRKFALNYFKKCNSLKNITSSSFLFGTGVGSHKYWFEITNKWNKFYLDGINNKKPIKNKTLYNNIW